MKRGGVNVTKNIFKILLASVLGAIISAPEQTATQEIEHVVLPWNYGAESVEIAEEENDVITVPSDKYNRGLLVRVVMSEAGNEPFIGKVAVATTVLNRADLWDMTVDEVVFSPNQYYIGYNGAPNDECFKAVDFALEHRDIFPADMVYFRNAHYHTFGTPFAKIGAHYFSTVTESTEAETVVKGVF